MTPSNQRVWHVPHVLQKPKKSIGLGNSRSKSIAIRVMTTGAIRVNQSFVSHCITFGVLAL